METRFKFKRPDQTPKDPPGHAPRLRGLGPAHRVTSTWKFRSPARGLTGQTGFRPCTWPSQARPGLGSPVDTRRSSRPCARHARDCGLRNTSGLYAVGTSTMHSEHRSIAGRGAIFGKRPPHRCLSARSALRPRDTHRFLSSRRSAAFPLSVSCCSPAKCLVCANATRRRRLGRWALRPGARNRPAAAECFPVAQIQK